MDFFEAQDRARRVTGKLVALYLIAVILIITSIYLIAVILFGYMGEVPPGASLGEYLWHPGLLLTVSTILIITILVGTIFRVIQLRRGGSAVAEMLGGRKIEPSTKDPKERQLVNVVEEMSIASGLPVPDIYVLDKEENINAFAAGYTSGDAAVGITRGALEQLNRDEIQGVIAHEFSHIFNGDMRLNIRLIGILNGILLLHVLGMILMRSTMYSGAMRGGGGSRGGGKSGGGNATIAIILFGLALVIIGYIGMIFGRMIQAAISRQREYLADAAAVQYTRNPEGLAGALRKIGQKKDGGKIKDGHAMELSHLFFARSFHSALDKLFATHPPLEKRIKAIDPAHDKEHEKMKERIRRNLERDHVAGSPVPAQKGGMMDKEILPGIPPEVLLGAIGSLDREQLTHAGKLLQSIPAELRQAAHEPLAAEALVYGLLITGQKSHQKSPAWLREAAGNQIADHLDQLLPKLNNARRSWYLPLAELSLPALRQMSKSQYKLFRQSVERMTFMDDRISLFEFTLEKMIIRQLDTAFSHRKKPEIRHHHLKTLGDEMTVLLSCLSHSSASDADKAWQAGVESVEKYLPEGLRLLPPEEATLEKLDKALDELAASANPVKKYALTAAIHCVASDRQISTDEAELLRAVGEALDTPIPVFPTDH